MGPQQKWGQKPLRWNWEPLRKPSAFSIPFWRVRARSERVYCKLAPVLCLLGGGGRALPGPAAASGGDPRALQRPRLPFSSQTHFCPLLRALPVRTNFFHSSTPKINVKASHCFTALEEVCLGLWNEIKYLQMSLDCSKIINRWLGKCCLRWNVYSRNKECRWKNMLVTICLKVSYVPKGYCSEKPENKT